MQFTLFPYFYFRLIVQTILIWFMTNQKLGPYGFHTACFKMYNCCHLYPRFVEGDLHDWQVGRHPSPVPLLVRPWLPHRERPHLDPFLDPQVPQPSRYQQLLNRWDSTFTVAPLPHLQWALLVRTTLGQKICAVSGLSVYFLNIVCPWWLAGCYQRAIGTLLFLSCFRFWHIFMTQ